jgi:hypothetical protein
MHVARGGASIVGILAALLAGTTGCTSVKSLVRAQAASDLECRQSDVAVEPLGATTYLATGCGASLYCSTQAIWTRPSGRGTAGAPRG